MIVLIFVIPVAGPLCAVAGVLMTAQLAATRMYSRRRIKAWDTNATAAPTALKGPCDTSIKIHHY